MGRDPRPKAREIFDPNLALFIPVPEKDGDPLIQNPKRLIQNPKRLIRNPKRLIQNPKRLIQNPKRRSHP